jgi:hypothetical protein
MSQVPPEVADFPRVTFYIALFANRMQITPVLCDERTTIFVETS